MRISDWSSDVCSSDLLRHGTLNEAAQLRLPLILQHGHAFLRTFLCHRTTTDQLKLGRFQRHPLKRVVLHDLHGNGGDRLPQPVDRQSVVWGRSVSVRVDLGGRGLLKKKKKNNTIN